MSQASNEGDDSSANAAAASSSSICLSNSKWQSFLFLLLLGGVVLFFYDAEVAEGLFDNNSGVGVPKIQNAPQSVDNDAQQNANNNLPPHQQTELIQRIRGYRQLVEQQRAQFFAQLQTEYGPVNVQNMFLFWQDEQFVSLGKWFYTSSHGRQSWFRLKRKFIIKLLQAAIAQQEQSQSKTQQAQQYFARFVWANGGHSSSAGHGNFFWESFTAVMERAMIPFFTPLGVEFVARNYAMGGTSSGEEVGLCMESIFGIDVDVLTWDYGMMDAGHHEHWKQLLYTYHTAMGRNRPVAVGLEFQGERTRAKIYSELERLGMGALYQNQPIFDRTKQAIPETQGLETGLIEQLPPFVRKFKCGGVLEKGDPGCREAKFNMKDCVNRTGQVNWHPGWKSHALNGNALALFLIEVLVDAVENLELLSEEENVKDVLDRLLVDEEESYANLLASPIPDKLSPIANWINGGKNDDVQKLFGNINLRELYTRRSFCHTALLPAEIRYQGLLSQNNGSTFGYDTGIPQPQPTDPIDTTTTNNDVGTMRLAYDPKQRQSECRYNIGIDYKDFFYLSSVEGWRYLTIPNDDEMKYYNVDTSQMIGMVITCLTGCEWNRCGNGDLRDEFDKGALKMHVNGVAVTEFTKLGICWALKNNENIYKWTPNTQGKFEIRARLYAEEYSFVRFSSFILV